MAPKDTDDKDMKISPEGLGVCEKGVETRDERSTPQISRGPTIGSQFRRSRQSERCRVKGGEHIGEEKTAVSSYLKEVRLASGNNV